MKLDRPEPDMRNGHGNRSYCYSTTLGIIWDCTYWCRYIICILSIRIHIQLHKYIYPPWSSHHIVYYCHRILQQYKYRCAFLSRLWYASGFLTRWTPCDHWWHTKSHPKLWGDWYAPETFPDAHVIYHAAWRGFWWHRPPDYQVEAGPMGLVATVASRCIYNLDSLWMSNKWLWSGMIDVEDISKTKDRSYRFFQKGLIFCLNTLQLTLKQPPCWETTTVPPASSRPFPLMCRFSFCKPQIETTVDPLWPYIHCRMMM